MIAHINNGQRGSFDENGKRPLKPWTRPIGLLHNEFNSKGSYFYSARSPRYWNAGRLAGVKYCIKILQHWRSYLKNCCLPVAAGGTEGRTLLKKMRDIKPLTFPRSKIQDFQHNFCSQRPRAGFVRKLTTCRISWEIFGRPLSGQGPRHACHCLGPLMWAAELLISRHAALWSDVCLLQPLAWHFMRENMNFFKNNI